jgi:hypothetical protein
MVKFHGEWPFIDGFHTPKKMRIFLPVIRFWDSHGESPVP